MDSPLKRWIRQQHPEALGADADDGQTNVAAGKLHQSGKLSREKWTELIRENTSGIKSRIKSLMKEVLTEGDGASSGDPQAKAFEERFMQYEAQLTEQMNELDQRRQLEAETKTKLPSAAKILGMGIRVHEAKEQFDMENQSIPHHLRVKDPTERYSTSRTTLKHFKSGQPVSFKGQPVESMTQQEFAKVGAWIKLLAGRAGANVQLSEHEEALLRESYEKDLWVIDGPEEATYAKGAFLKASLLSDATSGGSYASPVWFDAAIVLFPLLYAELYPYVDVVDVPRGNTINAIDVSNPTLTWGQAEGSAITEFDCTDLVNQISATVFSLMAAITIGRDTLADSSPDLGEAVVQGLSQRQGQELDKVIAVGNGTTQPQGITQASGVADVTFASATTGPYVATDAIDLMFAIAKQYQDAARYGMTFTTYKRFRSLSTGVTGDDRLLFGMNVRNYQLLEAPVAIETAGLTNDQLFYGQLMKYRMWRRQGAEVRWTDEGSTLRKANMMLLTVRSRWAGKPVDPNAFAVSSSGIP